MQKESANRSEELSAEERFAQAYEGATLTPISYDELPSEVIEHIEANSSKYILPETYVPRNFTHIYLLTHPNGSKTYVAEQTKTYGQDGDTEELAYFVDYEEGHLSGHGELRNNISNHHAYFQSKPFVGFSRTYSPQDRKGEGSDFRHRGLGKRRVIEMDAYARSRFGNPLNSDSLISDEAKGVWEKLVQEGKAESFMEGKGKDAALRFRMK